MTRYTPHHMHGHHDNPHTAAMIDAMIREDWHGLIAAVQNATDSGHGEAHWPPVPDLWCAVDPDDYRGRMSPLLNAVHSGNADAGRALAELYVYGLRNGVA